MIFYVLILSDEHINYVFFCFLTSEVLPMNKLILMLLLFPLLVSCGGGGGGGDDSNTMAPIVMEPTVPNPGMPTPPPVNPAPVVDYCKSSACRSTTGLSALIDEAMGRPKGVKLTTLDVTDTHSQQVRSVLGAAMPNGWAVDNVIVKQGSNRYFETRDDEREIANASIGLSYPNFGVANPGSLLIVNSALNEVGDPDAITISRVNRYLNDGVAYIFTIGLDGNSVASGSSNCGSELMNICLGSDYSVSVDGRSGSLRGNSFAAPNVAGGLVTVAALFPEVDIQRLDDLAFECAEDLGVPGVDAIYGHGRFSLMCMITPEGVIRLPDGYSPLKKGGISIPMGSVTGLSVSSMTDVDSYGRSFTYTVSSRNRIYSAFWKQNELLNLVFEGGDVSNNFEVSRGRDMFFHSTRQDNNRFGGGLGVHKRFAGVHLLGGVALEENSAMLGTVSLYDGTRGVGTTGHLTVAKDMPLLSGNFILGGTYVYSKYHGGYEAQLHSPTLWSSWIRHINPATTFTLTGFYTSGVKGELTFPRFNDVGLRVTPEKDFTVFATLQIRI